MVWKSWIELDWSGIGTDWRDLGGGSDEDLCLLD